VRDGKKNWRIFLLTAILFKPGYPFCLKSYRLFRLIVCRVKYNVNPLFFPAKKKNKAAMGKERNGQNENTILPDRFWLAFPFFPL
jgi:hypothetical protein